MNHADWERAAAVYLPVSAALLARMLRGRQPRQFVACLLSLLWVAPALLAVQRLNALANWWTFSSDGVLFRGMPVEFFVGWMVLWGVVPQVAFPRLKVLPSVLLMTAIDLILMPVCSASLHLGSHWLLGEVVAVIVVLLPALWIAKRTSSDTCLRGRAALLIATSGMLFLFLIPETAFALRPGEGWIPLLRMGNISRQLGLQAMLLLAIPGVSAVIEFAERGRGTPIPFDPPHRLVTSGIYRYCANPMQLSCAMVMLLWAAMLRNGWLLLAAGLSIAYSAGIAEWDERQDLARRFGHEWRAYRAEVHDWWPRWRPYHVGPAAVLYIARTCVPCSEVRTWLEAGKPLGLQIIDAETLPSGLIQRMRYDPSDGGAAVEGVRAMGRALEHLHLGWAIAGCALRLPGLCHIAQLMMDAGGLSPRLLNADLRES